MAKYQSKADKAFMDQLTFLLGEARKNSEHERLLPLDVPAVSMLFERYGAHLELLGGDEPVQEARVFVWPAPPVVEEATA